VRRLARHRDAPARPRFALLRGRFRRNESLKDWFWFSYRNPRAVLLYGT
jgi:hypothetical protein